MEFKATESCYKPQPIWLWNTKLNTDETTDKLDKINLAGFGGFSVSPSAGLSAGYLSGEWFRNLSAALKGAADKSMESWVFDESPGSSSYSNAGIDSKGLELQQKFLRFETGEKTNERTIIFSDGCHFYYDVNPFCIDVYSEDSASVFISEAYLPYTSKLQESFTGFMLNTASYFTEEIPWSFTFPAEYKKAYGEELLDVLIQLFRPVGEYNSTRYKFWRLVFELFETNFLKPIYDWCNEKGLKLTVINQHGTVDKSFVNAPLMSKSRYSHIPCIVAESPEDISEAEAIMLSSAMHQTGKSQAAAILYSFCGHGRSSEELKHMAQQYLVRGINKIIPSAVPYSLDGFRKNTVSTPVICQNHRFPETNLFSNYISTVCKILTEGAANFDTLLIHNQTSALKTFDAQPKENCYLANTLGSAISKLEKKHIPFHIGDEILLEKLAYVDGDTLVVGQNRYKTIVLTENPELSEYMSKLLTEFERGGGFITMPDSLPESNVCDNENLLYTIRSFPNCEVHYFVNNSSESFTASISKGSKLIDVSTGELLPFFGIYKFNAYESVLVVDDGTTQLSRPYSKPLKDLDIRGIWEIDESSLNSLVIDKCDVYVDNEILHEDIDANSVSELLCRLGVSVNVRCDYKFNIITPVDRIYLTNLTSGNSETSINGTPFDMVFEDIGDALFPGIDISPYITKGENVISVSAKIENNSKFLSLYEKASAYETELSKFKYEKDFSPLILSGEFGVVCDGKFMKLDKNSSRYNGSFMIGKMPSECDISNIEKCGFPFFAGAITFKKTFNLSDTSYCIKFSPKHIRSISVEINGKKSDVRCYSPYEYDLSEFLNKGNNEIKITVTGNLRNLFGPHHSPLGELCKVTPAHFYKDPCIWNKNSQTPWSEGYCFVEFALI